MCERADVYSTVSESRGSEPRCERSPCLEASLSSLWLGFPHPMTLSPSWPLYAPLSSVSASKVSDGFRIYPQVRIIPFSPDPQQTQHLPCREICKVLNVGLSSSPWPNPDSMTGELVNHLLYILYSRRPLRSQFTDKCNKMLAFQGLFSSERRWSPTITDRIITFDPVCYKDFLDDSWELLKTGNSRSRQT